MMQTVVATHREKKPWPLYVASFLLNDMKGACKRRGLLIENCGVDPRDIGYLLQLNFDGHIDRKIARASLEFMLDQAKRADDCEILSHALLNAIKVLQT